MDILLTFASVFVARLNRLLVVFRQILRHYVKEFRDLEIIRKDIKSTWNDVFFALFLQRQVSELHGVAAHIVPFGSTITNLNVHGERACNGLQ